MSASMNFILANKKFVNTVLILITITFLWFGTFGLLFHVNEMKVDSQMSNCLFNGQEEVCNMNVSEHLSVWQSMITSLPQTTGLLGLLLLSVVLVAVFISLRDILSKLSEKIRFLYTLYIKQHPQISLYNFLREIFSQGILNPKLFVSTI